MKKADMLQDLKHPPCFDNTRQCPNCAMRFCSLTVCLDDSEGEYVRQQAAEKLKNITDGRLFAGEKGQITLLEITNKIIRET